MNLTKTKITFYNFINLKYGYPLLEIRSQREIILIDKRFDAVGMMREIRDKLSKKYAKDPEAEKRDLEAIRRKYKIKEREKGKLASHQQPSQTPT